MCEEYNELVKTVVSWDWVKILQAGASIFTATIAYLALNTWKKKSKADTKTKFLDILLDDCHHLLIHIYSAISVYKIIKMEVNEYLEVAKIREQKEWQAYKEYIEKAGLSTSKLLEQKVNECDDYLTKIQLLIAKGQIYDFVKYEECEAAVATIVKYHNYFQYMALIIGNQCLNWENPEIIQAMRNLLSQEPDTIKNQLEEQNKRIIEFAKINYSGIYDLR